MKKIIVLCAIIACLTAISYGLYTEKTGLFVLTQEYNKDVFTKYKSGDVLAGEIISAEIVSKENNLGTIAIRFDTFGKVKNDTFVFRLKEQGAADWYYTNIYKAKEFGGFPFFPFGFPVITKSKDKTYIFELESQSGGPGNTIAIALGEPTIEMRYGFTKAELLSNKTLLSLVLSKKILQIAKKRKVQYMFLFIFILTFLPFLLQRHIKFVKSQAKKQTRKFVKNAKLKKGAGQIYEIAKPMLGILTFIGSWFTRMVKLVGYFYNWLGKE